MQEAHPRPAKRFDLRDLHGTCSSMLHLVLCISFFLNRKSSPVRSHLPVKSMLFHCVICSHGGHQTCYRQFYAKIPLILLPTTLAPSSTASPLKVHHRLTRSTSRSNDGEADDSNTPPDWSFDTSTVTPASSSQLLGHPCAAGCGHFCWVANIREEDTEKP